MNEILKNSPKEPSSQIEAAADQLRQILTRIGLDEKVAVTTELTKKGTPQIVLAGPFETRITWESGLKQVLEGKISLLMKFLGRSFTDTEDDVTTTELLAWPAFASSSLTELRLKTGVKGNVLLTNLASIPENTLPCLYGSTDGLNFAELVETLICAKSIAQKEGVESPVIFDTGGHASERSYKIYRDSIKILPLELGDQFNKFLPELGETLLVQRINAAKKLLGQDNAIFVSGDEIFVALGEKFTVGKLLLLARIAGGDPLVFGDMKASYLLKRDINAFAESVASWPTKKGFTFYAREAVIAADFPGIFAIPFKLTTHANVYKILGGYSSLVSQNNGERGAILCPIQRQRIQTRQQALEGTDPCDVTVLAFLAEKFPNGFANLMGDFANSCKVLTPADAIETGTGDNRFIIENYFPLEEI